MQTDKINQKTALKRLDQYGRKVALIPGAITLVLFAGRTMIEDKILIAELTGYSDFTLKTRYRLAPGVW